MPNLKTLENSFSSGPKYVLVELTQGCNLSCHMCRNEVINVNSRKMHRELFAKIANELFESAQIVDLRGWGESLILEDISYFIDKTIDYGVDIRFVTNLSFSRMNILTQLAKHNALISVSLDAACQEHLAIARKGASFKLIIKNLTHLIQSYVNYGSDIERISIIYTLQNYTYKDLPHLISILSEVGIQKITLNRSSYHHDSKLALNVNDPTFIAMIEHSKFVAESCGISLQTLNPLNGLHKERTLDPCCHPWTHFVINYDGLVTFCDHLIGPDIKGNVLGNITNESFEKIWNSKEWEDIKTQHAKSKDIRKITNVHCRWCYKNRYPEYDHLFFTDIDPNTLANHDEEF